VIKELSQSHIDTFIRILFELGLVRLRRLVGDMRIPTMDPEKPRGNLTIQLFPDSLDHSSSTPAYSTKIKKGEDCELPLCLQTAWAI